LTNRIPATLKLTVPLILLGFAAILSTVNMLYHVPQAERAAEEDSRKRLAQEMSRLQSTLEYLLLKGDIAAAQREIAVLAHNHEVTFAALTDDRNTVVEATRRASMGLPIATVLPHFDLGQAAIAVRERRAGMTVDSKGEELLGYAGVLMGGERDELRPTRTGSLFLAYDLKRYKAEARAQVLKQSLYWAGWVTALALAMWLVFHFLLTRRTARLVHAAEELAEGHLSARSGLRGGDELGRLSRAFDAMAGAIASDIAERRRSDEALRVSEASYRAIFDAAEDAIFVIDIETAGIVDANPRACAAFGYGREEFRTLELGELGSGVHPYTHEGAMGLFARAVSGEQLQVEWHAKSKDGRLRWHEVFGKRVTIGGQDRILALARDITDRKMAEEALRASEEQYRSMFNASIDGLALWNAAGEMVDTNPALWRMYGYSDGESTALRPASWKGPSYRPAALQVSPDGESLHSEVTERRLDGSPLELDVHGIPMQYRGKPHVLTIARDITEKKRSAAELARQRESLYQREKLAALGSLLAGVAHELNNPLSVVVARAVLLEEQGDSATQVAALKIRTAAERCARIVRTFLAMARQQQPERGPVAVNEVVTAALDIASYAIRTSSIEVVLDLADDIPPILADADQLHQVLLNLVINAQQSLQDRPVTRRIKVKSSFDARADLVRIKVADNGPGIPESLRARVFEPYFTTKPTGVGTGVGLAVSLGIIEAHGGTLTVECPTEGGAVFTIKLPVGSVDAHVARHEAAAEAEPGPAGDTRGRRRARDSRCAGRNPRGRAAPRGHGELRARGAGADGGGALRRDPHRHPHARSRRARALPEIERRWPGQTSRVIFVTGDTLATALRRVRRRERPPGDRETVPAERSAARGR
jgi:PAS domain S-box-containing protein